MMYFQMPDGRAVAENYRAGSMSVASAIIENFYPDLKRSIDTACSPDYRQRTYKFALPKTSRPSNKTYLLVREPLARFTSAASIFGINQAMQKMKSDDEHFTLQRDFHFTKAFAFPAQLNDFCNALAIPFIPWINSTREKIILTSEQAMLVRDFYAADVTLYQSLQ